MAQLNTKIKLYLEANSKTWNDTKVTLQDNSDGNGAFISSWSYDIAQPTTEQIASYETAGNTAETLANILAKREIEYPSLKEFTEAYCEKEIGGDSKKWNAYKIAYNKVRTDNPKE